MTERRRAPALRRRRSGELDSLVYSSKLLVADAGNKLSKQQRARVDREIARAEQLLAPDVQVHRASEELYRGTRL